MNDHESQANPGSRQLARHGSSSGPNRPGPRRRPRRRVTRRAGGPMDAQTAAQNLAAKRSARAAQQSEDSPVATGPHRVAEHKLHGEIPSLEAAPFVTLEVATSGIHPTTSRLVAMSLVFYGPSTDADVPGEEVSAVTLRFNPGEDIGPWHLHGFHTADVAQEPSFTNSTDTLFRALDGRTVVLHRCALTWGFIMQEFKRAQRTINRSRRGRGGRGRGRGHSNPPPKIALPVPTEIIDTLATARRQSLECYDSRIRAVTAAYVDRLGRDDATLPASTLPELGAQASQERGSTDPKILMEADARLVTALFLMQLQVAQSDGGAIARSVPAELTADQFGLQRSSVRVDAAIAPRPHVNPGQLPTGGQLVQGMEFVISPDVATNPDTLIAAGVREGLVYSEKLNRRSSLVVCNTNHELRGKAMHADRKGIPLVSDTEFLALLEHVQPGELEETPQRPGAGARPNTRGWSSPSRSSTAVGVAKARGARRRGKRRGSGPNRNEGSKTGNNKGGGNSGKAAGGNSNSGSSNRNNNRNRRSGQRNHR
ncbi:DNA polymerase III subunit epsilon [Corynebacterium resistens]|uniref:DNA polymerase III subunit epsilon n=1 Tax=Corynebacterium resistens TaxID=258224 RepID=UPI002357CF91|nr:DNA polymerase III subunit epsilon [Corynebacterium resistens]